MGPNKSMRGDLFLSQSDIAQLYENEALLFSRVRRSDLYDKIRKETGVLADLTANAKSIKMPAPLRRNQYIDLTQNTDWIRVVAGVAQVAATCYLLQGCSFNAGIANDDFFKALARDAVDRFVQAHGENGLRRLSTVLEGVEGIRIGKILRALGLFALAGDKVHQLSLGAGSGIKDLEGMYSESWVQEGGVFQNDLSSFKVRHGRAKHTVLVDMESGYKERYDALNSDCAGEVLALNQDVASAIPVIQAAIERGEIERRNVVAIFRMDPVLIPDVKEFFGALKKVASEISHFIVSIGSGNDIDEFKARLDKMDQIKKYLKGRKQDVYTIKLCTGKSAELCLDNPMFGSRAFAIYEIVYCRISNKFI